MQMRITKTPLSGESSFHKETKAVLALLRNLPEVPEEDDPNGWFLQICEHLRRSPKERMERWARFSGDALRRWNDRHGMPHARFDPVRVLRALSDRRVGYVVVGMGAGYLRGVPYPSYNIDITPRLDLRNVLRLEQVLGWLESRPLDWDEWGPVQNHGLSGFRRLMTTAGMVNVVNAPWGIGGYDQVTLNADHLEVDEGLVVPVASLEDVIASKEAMRDLPERPLPNRTMDNLHVDGKRNPGFEREVRGPVGKFVEFDQLTSTIEDIITGCGYREEDREWLTDLHRATTILFWSVIRDRSTVGFRFSETTDTPDAGGKTTVHVDPPPSQALFDDFHLLAVAAPFH